MLAAGLAPAAYAQTGLLAARTGTELLPDQYICAFRQGFVPVPGIREEADRIARSIGATVSEVYASSLLGFSLSAPEEAIRRLLLRNPDVAYCEPDQIVRLVPETRGRRTAEAPVAGAIRQVTPWGITRVAGGVRYTGRNRAWVIDTGVDETHPDLNIDRAKSRSFGRDSSWSDVHGHGTHVAGIIGAKDNAIGVVGVAAGAPIVAVRVLEANGAGPISKIIAGVDYVAARAAPGDVANLSLNLFPSEALDNAVLAASAKGVWFTLAAGNFNIAAGLYSPTRVDGQFIRTVSAFKKGDIRSSFSNFGNPPIDLAEPGEDILSTWKGGGYRTLNGTSQAAPHAAGILLLGPVMYGGTVKEDPDGTPDIIGAHRLVLPGWTDPALAKWRFWRPDIASDPPPQPDSALTKWRFWRPDVSPGTKPAPPPQPDPALTKWRFWRPDGR